MRQWPSGGTSGRRGRRLAIAAALSAAVPLAHGVSATVATAQLPVRIESRPAGAQVINDLPLPIVALIHDGTVDARQTRASVAVDARGNASVSGRAASLAVDLFEVISPTVPLRAGWTAPCPGFDAVRMQASLRALQSELDALPIEQRREGAQAMYLAASVAELRHREFRDSIRLADGDPVAALNRTRMLEHGSNQQAWAVQDEIEGGRRRRALAELGNMTTVYAEQMEAKYKVLAQDAVRYRKLMETTASVLDDLQRRSEQVRADVVRFSEYQRAVIDAIERVAEPVPSAADAVTSQVTRPCAGAANVNDFLAVSVPSTSEVTVMVGQVTFDYGAPQLSLLRRVRGSDIWVGRFAWPADASTASLRVRAAGTPRWASVAGVIRTGRASLSGLQAQLSAQLTLARKRYADMSQRAKGSDHVRTLSVP